MVIVNTGDGSIWWCYCGSHGFRDILLVMVVVGWWRWDKDIDDGDCDCW